MSQGIMEKNLPVAESIQSGDKIRIVTSAGNSKQVDASQIGGGGMVLTLTETGIAESYSEIADALNRGIIPIALLNSTEGDDTATIIFSVTELQTTICPDQGYTIYSCSGNVLGTSRSFYATNENSPMSFTMPECTGK